MAAERMAETEEMRLFVAGLDLTGIHLPPVERRKARDAMWSQAHDDLVGVAKLREGKKRRQVGRGEGGEGREGGRGIS